MRILAVDQSFTSCGLFVLEDCDENVINVLHSERFVSDRNLDIFARAWQVTERIDVLSKRFNVHHVALEGLAFSQLGNATRDLAGLQFTIVVQLRRENMDVLIIPPKVVKKLATGKGNAKKEQLYEALPANIKQLLEANNYKKTTGRYDMSDAYWIGISAIRELNKISNKNKKNTDDTP